MLYKHYNKRAEAEGCKKWGDLVSAAAGYQETQVLKMVDHKSAAEKIINGLKNVALTTEDDMPMEMSQRADEILAAIHLTDEEGKKIAPNIMSFIIFIFNELGVLTSVKQQQLLIINLALMCRAMKNLVFDDSGNTKCCIDDCARDASYKSCCQHNKLFCKHCVHRPGLRCDEAACSWSRTPIVALDKSGKAPAAKAVVDPNLSIDHASILEAQLSAAILTQHPMPPEEIEKANCLLAALLVNKATPTDKLENAFEFLLAIMDMYRKKKLTSLSDKRILLLHMAEVAEIVSEIMFPEGMKCSLCDEVSEMRSLCCLQTQFCGPCSLKKGNTCIMNCAWSGLTYDLLPHSDVPDENLKEKPVTEKDTPPQPSSVNKKNRQMMVVPWNERMPGMAVNVNGGYFSNNEDHILDTIRKIRFTNGEMLLRFTGTEQGLNLTRLDDALEVYVEVEALQQVKKNHEGDGKKAAKLVLPLIAKSELLKYCTVDGKQGGPANTGYCCLDGSVVPFAGLPADAVDSILKFVLPMKPDTMEVKKWNSDIKKSVNKLILRTYRGKS